MKKSAFFFLSILLWSCKPQLSQESNSVLMESKFIEYSMRGTDIIQLVRSVTSIEEESIIDTTLIIDKYHAKLLIEQSIYKIQQGDSIISSKKQYKYDQRNNLLLETVSNGAYTSRKSYIYDKGNKQISSRCTVIFHDNKIENLLQETQSGDTTYIIVQNHFDEKTNLVKSVTINWDSPIYGSNEEFLPDTTTSFHEYDSDGNKRWIISLTAGDTTAMQSFEYDEFNRKSKTVEAKFGLFATDFIEIEYNSNGDKISKTFTSNYSSASSTYNYNSMGQLISEIIYFTEIPADNSNE